MAAPTRTTSQTDMMSCSTSSSAAAAEPLTMRQIRAELRKALTKICHAALADQRITAALPDGHELDPLDLLSGLIKSHAWTAKAKNTITISSEEIDMLLQKLSSPRRIKRAAARVDAFFELCEWSGQADLMAGIAVKSPYPALSDPERLHLKFTEDERLGILCRHVCIESGHSFSKTRLTEHGKEARKRYEKIGADLRKAEAEAVAAKRPSSRSRKAAQEKEDGKALSAARCAANSLRSAGPTKFEFAPRPPWYATATRDGCSRSKNEFRSF